jgi:hypothetical protein
MLVLPRPGTHEFSLLHALWRAPGNELNGEILLGYPPSAAVWLLENGWAGRGGIGPDKPLWLTAKAVAQLRADPRALEAPRNKPLPYHPPARIYAPVPPPPPRPAQQPTDEVLAIVLRFLQAEALASGMVGLGRVRKRLGLTEMQTADLLRRMERSNYIVWGDHNGFTRPVRLGHEGRKWLLAHPLTFAERQPQSQRSRRAV